VSPLEIPIVFRSGSETLIGILHRPETVTNRGVVIVVGGPQYRVGSHRQFVHLARSLAKAGVPVFRFDYQGMGDATGEYFGFENIDDDINAALNTFCSEMPDIEQIVLWGLCDGASAIAMYRDPHIRVCGMVLINPWVRSEQGLAKARVNTYYWRRLGTLEFWRRLFSGAADIRKMSREFFLTMTSAIRLRDKSVNSELRFQERMAVGLKTFGGRLLIIISGQDITAAEFESYRRSSRRWKDSLSRCTLTVKKIDDADHTFSSHKFREMVANITIEWVTSP